MSQNTIKKTGLVLFLAVFSLFIALNSAEAAQQGKQSSFSIAFKLCGGAGFALNGGGDIEKNRQGFKDYFADIGEEDFETTTFNWKRMTLIPNFEAELMFIFAKNFGVGIGSGYVTGTSKGDYQEVYQETWTSGSWTYNFDITDTYTRNYTVNAIPIRFSFYFFMPMNSINLYGYLGAGYYMGKLKHDLINDYEYLYSDSHWYYADYKHEHTETFTVNEEAKGNGLGFHGGLGLGINLSSNITFGIEFYGRIVNFNKWDGDYREEWNGQHRYYLEGYGWYSTTTYSGDYEESGLLYSYDWRSGWFDKYYFRMWIWEEKPSGSYYKNVKQASINLNAFGITASIIFRFDLM